MVEKKMSEQKELFKFEEKTVLQCFARKGGLDLLLGDVKALIKLFDHDMSTAGSRAKTASLAHKVAKFKTKIDGLGKDLVADWKTKAKAVDANRKSMRDALDELKIEARKPLDDWEAEQAKIEADKQAIIAAQKLAAEKEYDHEIAVLLDRERDRLKQEKIDELARIAAAAKQKEELDRKERDDRIAKEVAAQVREKEKQKRIKLENDSKKAALVAKERAHEAKVALDNAEADRIAAEAKAKQDSIDAEKRQEQAVKDTEERIKLQAKAAKDAADAALKAREADQNKKKERNNRLLDGMVKIGISEAHGKELITAIYRGKFPDLRINY